MLNAVAKNVPWLIGGAADLAPSTKTRLTFDGAGDFEAGSYGGRNFHFGIREHAMGAIMNGMALVKVRAFGAGFLIFSDYGRLPIRLAAPDGDPGDLCLHARLDRRRRRRPDPPAGRALAVIAGDPRHDRPPPCDANEVVEAWRDIMKLHHRSGGPGAHPQDLPTLDRTKYAPAAGFNRALTCWPTPPDGKPDVLLLAPAAKSTCACRPTKSCTAEGMKARVVSMPSWEIFEHQEPAEYSASVSAARKSPPAWPSNRRRPRLGYVTRD